MHRADLVQNNDPRHMSHNGLCTTPGSTPDDTESPHPTSHAIDITATPRDMRVYAQEVQTAPSDRAVYPMAVIPAPRDMRIYAQEDVTACSNNADSASSKEFGMQVDESNRYSNDVDCWRDFQDQLNAQQRLPSSTKETNMQYGNDTQREKMTLPVASPQALERLRNEFFSPVVSFGLNSTSAVAGVSACQTVASTSSKVSKPAHKMKRIPTSQRVQQGVKGRHTVKKDKPDLSNCARLVFQDSACVKRFIQSATYYIVDLPETSDIKQRFDSYPFAFHKPEYQAEGKNVVLTTKAGWAMLPDQNVIPLMFEAIEILKQVDIDFKEIARKSFGIKGPLYMFIGADRWKSQNVGPGNPTEPEKIAHKCWQQNLHVDLRESRKDEHQLAFLFNFGKFTRYMVVTDLTILKKEREKLKTAIAEAEKSQSSRLPQLLTAKERMGNTHMRIYELLHHVQQNRKGYFSKFTKDEKLLLKQVMKAVKIQPGQALLFPQFLPHSLTNCTTSNDPNAKADTFYLGLKMSENLEVLQHVQRLLIEKFSEGGQHVYQQSYGRNGFTDARINAEHREKLLECIFKQYNIPQAYGKTGGMGGITAKNPLPTVKQFVSDVKAARQNPGMFAPGMTCPHLNVDDVLIPIHVLEKAMEIIPL